MLFFLFKHLRDVQIYHSLLYSYKWHHYLRQKQWQTGPMLNLRRHVSKTYHAEFWIINTKHIYGFSWKRDFTNERNTHYIHSVMVQDFVSGPACCVNQYHYESRKRRVLMRLFTPQAWYKVLHQHTMYVISLSNISIKTNFKQITRVEIRSTNLYNTLGRLHFVHDVMLFVAVHCFALLTQLTLACFLLIPMIWRHDKVVR